MVLQDLLAQLEQLEQLEQPSLVQLVQRVQLPVIALLSLLLKSIVIWLLQLSSPPLFKHKL
jgi:hypothetical protein